jgi:hypothetical protein
MEKDFRSADARRKNLLITQTNGGTYENVPTLMITLVVCLALAATAYAGNMRGMGDMTSFTRGHRQSGLSRLRHDGRGLRHLPQTAPAADPDRRPAGRSNRRHGKIRSDRQSH